MNVTTRMDIFNGFVAFNSLGFSQQCAGSNLGKLHFRWFKNATMGSGHTFTNIASKFRDVMYLISLVGRFQYSFKRNCTKHMIVVCIVVECSCKITCHAIGSSNEVQVHNHTLEDVALANLLLNPLVSYW